MAITSSSIGSRIRQLRQQRGLPLAEVAQRAGHTKGFLSKIERAKASPPIATLLRLAAALQVEPSELLEASPLRGTGSRQTLHVTPAQRVHIESTSAGPGYAFTALAAQRGHKRMEPFLLTVDPKEIDPSRTFEHPGEEFVFVLEGELDYRVGDQVFPLKTGDSLYFDGSLPHTPLPRKHPATFLAIFSAPQRRLRSSRKNRASPGARPSPAAH
jgi:transcriptional regulator with XRE-family HTH domain